MPVSPGIYTREFDFSQYTPKLGLTRLALVGTASKGPLNTPTLVRNEGELVRIFGNPLLDDYGLQAAVRFLRQGNGLLYTRVASGAATASYPVPGFISGTAAAAASGTITLTANPADADTVTIYSTIATAYLSQDSTGTAGNTGITISGANIAVTKRDSTLAATPVGFSGGTVTAAAQATIRFTGNLTASNTVTLSDGATSVTFTAVASGATGNQFNIGTDAYATMTNLITAINANAFGITAVDAVTKSTFEFDSNNSTTAGNVAVNIGSTSLETMSNLVNALSASSLPLTVVNVSGSGSVAVSLKSTVAGAQCNATITKSGTNITVAGLSGGTNATTGTAGTGITFLASTPGSWGNGLSVQITSPTVALGATTADASADPVGNRFDIGVYERSTDGTTYVLRERFTNLSMYAGSARYVTTALAYGITGEFAASTLIRSVVTSLSTSIVSGTYALGTGNGTVGTNGGGSFTSAPSVVFNGAGTGAVGTALVVGGRVVSVVVTSGGTGYPSTGTITFTGGGGANATATYTAVGGVIQNTVNVTNGGGLVASDYVGTVTGQTATGIQALRNAETTEFNVLAIPGVTHKTVIQAALDLATARGDFLYLVDTPFGLTPQGVIDWHNGNSFNVPNSPTGPINSNYAAIYWGWCKVTDTYNNTDVWLPPSGFVAAAMAYTDNTRGPWWTTAGPVRGGVDALAVEYSPTQSERDALQGIDTTNRINPLVQFADGIYIWGNRTTQRKRSALESVHIRRMLIHAEKICASAVRVLVFDPNDETTWREFTMLVNDQLKAIKAGRGIEDFRVICDASTNPADQRQQKTLRGKMLIKPVEAAEIVMLDFSLFPTGASFVE